MQAYPTIAMPIASQDSGKPPVMSYGAAVPPPQPHVHALPIYIASTPVRLKFTPHKALGQAARPGAPPHGVVMQPNKILGGKCSPRTPTWGRARPPLLHQPRNRTPTVRRCR